MSAGREREIGERTREEWMRLCIVGTDMPALISAAFGRPEEREHYAKDWSDWDCVCGSDTCYVTRIGRTERAKRIAESTLATAQQRIEEMERDAALYGKATTNRIARLQENLAAAEARVSALTKELETALRCQHCGEMRQPGTDCDAALKESNQGWMDEVARAEKERDEARSGAVAVNEHYQERALVAEARVSALEAEKAEAVEAARTLGQQLERRSQGRDAETQNARISKLEEALRAAMQFMEPASRRGPFENGWQNTLDACRAALSQPSSTGEEK